MMLSLPPLSPNMCGLSPVLGRVDLRLLEIMMASTLSQQQSLQPCLVAQYLLSIKLDQSSIVEDLPGKWIKSLRYLPIQDVFTMLGSAACVMEWTG